MPRWIKLVAIVLLIVIGGTLLWWQMEEDGSLLRLDGHSYHITVMRTTNQLQKGLSGTDGLAANDAMVFSFPRDDSWPMWMKGMKYPIDMVWLNDGGEVVYTVKDAQPSSYPKTFQSPAPARYVIELPAGTVAKTGIKNGDPAGLPSGV